MPDPTKELIDAHQAQWLMLAILVAAPVVGLVWGMIAKRAIRGFALGTAIGCGNYALWGIYNAITDRLGLDTVANLLTNLALFVALGVAVGIAAGFAVRRKELGDEPRP